jgi:amidase
MNRRNFLCASATAITGAVIADGAINLSALAQGASRSFEFEEATIGQLQIQMQRRALSARELTEAYLRRIERIDKRGANLNSVIEINPEALGIAAELDRERRSGNVRGPLHGIPVLIKDNIDTADLMETTAGSLALVGSRPQRDAAVAEKLRRAGAVIIGKANLSEWANFRSTRSSSGWSARGGQTRNPYALDRNPCGSSSGSAASVAANLAVVSVGTETDGSIVCPSSANGVVGIKPTVGLVSRAGIIPISHSQDTAGPMTRTVTDAAILLTILAGYDARDEATSQVRTRRAEDYTQALDRNGLRGARIGVARRFFGFSDAVDRLMNDAISRMREQGAEMIDITDFGDRRELSPAEFEVLLYEFKTDLNAYLSSRGAPPQARTLQDLIEFNNRTREREMPFFGQDIFIRSQAKGTLEDEAYRRARATCIRLARTEGIDRVMTQNRLDAIVAPTGSAAWPTDLINGDHFTGGSSTFAAVAGYPNITVPAGFVFGLPVGISFFGRAFSEAQLIKLAFAFEQATLHRRPPRLSPSVEMQTFESQNRRR